MVVYSLYCQPTFICGVLYLEYGTRGRCFDDNDQVFSPAKIQLLRNDVCKGEHSNIVGFLAELHFLVILCLVVRLLDDVGSVLRLLFNEGYLFVEHSSNPNPLEFIKLLWKCMYPFKRDVKRITKEAHERET